MFLTSKNFLYRIITAAVALAVIIPIIWYGGFIRTFLVLLLYGACMFELFSVTVSLPKKAIHALVVFTLLPPFFVLFLGTEVYFYIILASSILLSIFLIALAEGLSNKPEFTKLLSMPLLSLLYPGIFLLSFLIVDQNFSGEYILWVMFSVIAADSLAYFVGSFAGGKALSPRISPNKTVSGSFAGILGATIVSLAWGTWFEFDQPILRLIILGLCIGFLSVLGDLFESFLKRSIGVKDMGSVLPGHGGILDRIDALLFAMPVLFFL